MKLKYLILLFVLPFVSCIKEDTNEIEGKGPQLLRFSGADSEVNTIGLDAVDQKVTVTMLTLQRDPNSQANLNTGGEAKLKVDNALVDAYNAEHGTEFVAPDFNYTINGLNANFTPGEFAKAITISLNPLDLDLSKQYLLGLAIESAPAGYTIVDGANKALFNILAKNKYDGKYVVTGTMVDYANAALTGVFPMNYHLITSGANSVDGWDPDVSVDYFVPIYNNGSFSWYGSYCPSFTFDPATDKITSVVNIYGQPAGNGRYAQLDPSGANQRNPDGSIDVKFFMFHPSAIPDGPRVAFSWHMEYEGPR